MNNLFSPLITIYKALYLFAYDITGNYGISLVLLSLFTFIVLYPFTKKAQHIQNKEHRIQSVLGPQIESIKKHYSGREQYEQLQWLYRRYSYHPLYAIRSALGFVFQIPFLTTAYYMLSGLSEIQDVSWGIIPNLGAPDHLLNGINILPFVMTLVTVVYAFVMPGISKKERMQTVGIGVFFLVLLYAAPSALLIFWTCNLIWSLLDSLLSEKLAWIGEYIAENELAIHIIFAFALTVGLLVPFEVYIKNASQIWFGITDIAFYFFSVSIKYFISLFIIYIICCRKKMGEIYLSLILGLLFGLFLQSYIISVDYGMFDGHEIHWEDYTWQGLVNTFIWLFCIGETFVIFRRLKFNEQKLKKFVKPLAFGIIVIQCLVLTITFSKNPLPENAFHNKDSINVLTTKNIFTISTKENIIIFLLDAFDARIFEEIMVKDPSIIEELNGFTFYPDTTSVYGYTDYSLPQILTGKIFYNDRPYIEYFEEAWRDNIYYKKLLDKNYEIGIYANGNLVSKSAPISNLIKQHTEINDDSMRGFKNLVTFRMVPHYAKKWFYEYDPNAWMNLLTDKNVEAYQEDDRKFFLKQKKGLIYHDNKNCFKFYHLVGAHYPFILDRNVEPISKDQKGSQYEQSIGALKIVLEYIKQMKLKEVFDDSTFVIMADHGDHNKVGSRPLLCIKKPGNKGEMKISDASVSFAQFMPMLFSQFDIDTIQKKFSEEKRYFYCMDEQNGFIRYQISGNSNDLNSWKREGFLQDRRDFKNIYKLGESIDFTLQGESHKYKGKGWSKREESFGTWTLGSDSDLFFQIKEYQQQDLKVDFVAFTYLANLPFRKVKVFANDNYITEIFLDNKKSLHSFIVPSMAIKKDILKLHFTIDNSGVSMKYENGRDLGIFMQNLKIDAVY